MFQPTMVYSDFLIKENVFSRGQFSSQYNERPTWISLTVLTIFEWSEVSTITVRSMKKYYMTIFHNKETKRTHFHCLPWMLAGSSGIVKVGGCVYQEVFKKQLLIVRRSS